MTEVTRNYVKETEKTFRQEINDSILLSKTYNGLYTVANDEDNTSILSVQSSMLVESPRIIIDNISCVDALEKYSEGRTCILVSTSFEKPCEYFTKDKASQETDICNFSFLYNVLASDKFRTFYNWNSIHQNKRLYSNRAVYIPKVKFANGKSCNIITCTPPYFNSAVREYKDTFNNETNLDLVISRLNFIKSIAEGNNIKTLILPDWGCDIDEQSADIMAKCMLKVFNHSFITNIIIAVENKFNYKVFYDIFEESGRLEWNSVD